MRWLRALVLGAVSLTLAIPLTFFGEWSKEVALPFLRYNDIVLIGVLLLITGVVLCYHALVERQ